MRDRRLVSAADMAQAISRDPQMRLPERPRVAPSVAVVPLDDGLLVDGGPELQVFRGSAALTVLPRVLRVLDGTRTLAEAAVAAGETEEVLVQVVSLLYSRGLLDDASVASASSRAMFAEPVHAFVSRHVDLTRVNRSVEEAAARTAAASLLVAGAPDVAAGLVAQLSGLGIAARIEGTHSDRVPSLLVGLCISADDLPCLDAVDARSRVTGVPWLRAAAYDGRLEIGPLFDPDEPACYRCFRMLHPVEFSVRCSADATLLWTALVATTAFAWSSRITAVLNPGELLSMDVRSWRQTRERVPRTVRCPQSHDEPAPPPTAYAYEQAVAFPSRSYISPKDHQIHYRVENLELQREAKLFPSLAHYELPAPQDTQKLSGDFLTGLAARPAERSAVDRATLASLLLRVIGHREQTIPGKLQRWAPTGGNLGSVQAYVLALSVGDLTPGAYFYEPTAHQLSALPRPRPPEVFTLAAQLGVDGLPAVLVFTAAYERVARKYGAFAYRIVLLDAGTAFAQLGAVSRGLGVPLRLRSRWDDDMLGTALGIDSSTEPITGVAELG